MQIHHLSLFLKKKQIEELVQWLNASLENELIVQGTQTF